MLLLFATTLRFQAFVVAAIVSLSTLNLGFPPRRVAAQNSTCFEFFATEHFRMSGTYWGLTALHLLGRLDLINGTDVVAWVLSCQRENGGFGGSERHDAHLLYTLSALQILALYDKLHCVDADAVAQCTLAYAAQMGDFNARMVSMMHA